MLGELGCRCEQGVEWGWDWRPGLYITQRRWNQLGRLSFFLFLTEETFYLSGEWFTWSCWESLGAGA